jgi:Tat protein translocase TatB subunit
MLQGQEIIVILLVALVVFGPHRLPDLARKLGGWANEVRKAAREIRSGLEAEVSEVKGVADEVRRPLREVRDALDETTRQADPGLSRMPWVGPTPTSGPTAEDALRDLERIEGNGERRDQGEAPQAGAGA